VKSLWTPGLGRFLLRRPVDAAVLVRAGWLLRRKEWWRHAPFLPLPDSAYWHFRMVTVNGTGAVVLSPAAMVGAARWALAQPVGRPS
jgi:hypothetical protein